jgi:hypothetical protein
MDEQKPEVKRPFWAWCFSDPDGTPSSARVITALVVLFALGWVTFLVRKHGVLPEFAGLTAFVSAIYAINKLRDGLGK